MTESTPSKPTLNAFDIGCVVVGGIIGVGIFFTPAQVARVVETPGQMILAWCVGGAMAILGGIVFALLSRSMPGHGGTFRYIHRAFGKFPAFLYGWCNWLVIQAGALGIIGIVMASYLDEAVFGAPRFGPTGHLVVAVVASLLFTALNAFGLRAGKRTQNTLTLLKTLAICGVVALAFVPREAVVLDIVQPAPVPGEPTESAGLFAILAAAMLPVLFSFGGWQQGSFLAGAAKRPERDVPIGLFFGVVVVAAAYITVNWSYLEILGLEGAASSSAIAADAATTALANTEWASLAGRLLSAAVVISCAGIMNTICMAPPWVLHTMAREGLFLRGAGELHATRQVPVLAVWVQGLWGVTLLVGVHAAVWLFGDADGGVSTAYDFLLHSVVFVDWLFFAMCGLACFRVIERLGLFGRLAAGAFICCALAVTVGSMWRYPVPSLAGLGIAAVGAVVYLVSRGRTT